MKLEINGEVYQVPRDYEEKIFDQLWKREALPWYAKLADTWKIGGMVISRGILAFMEKQIEGEQGREMARKVRPPKGTDPNLHLGELLARMLLEGVNHVTLACETSTGPGGEKCISAFNIQVDVDQVRTVTTSAESERQAR